MWRLERAMKSEQIRKSEAMQTPAELCSRAAELRSAGDILGAFALYYEADMVDSTIGMVNPHLQFASEAQRYQCEEFTTRELERAADEGNFERHQQLMMRIHRKIGLDGLDSESDEDTRYSEDEDVGAELEFSVGDRVRVHGLTGATEHNGKEGEITGYDAQRQRWRVAVRERRKTRHLNVKTENLSQNLQ
jgi:hypothetical protein